MLASFPPWKLRPPPSDGNGEAEERPYLGPHSRSRRTLALGSAASLILHGLVALALILLLVLRPPIAPPPEPSTIAVELVAGEPGAAQAEVGTAGESERQPQPLFLLPSLAGIPLLRMPAPAQPRSEPENGPRPDPRAPLVPPPKPPVPHPSPPAESAKPPEVAPQAAPPASTFPGSSGAVGAPSSATVGGGSGEAGLSAASVRDFIRAQIERRWNFDANKIDATGRLVTLHLQLYSDGKVMSAAVVPDPGRAHDNDYLALAQTARNAALIAAPLAFPPEFYGDVKDFTLTLDPHQAAQ